MLPEHSTAVMLFKFVCGRDCGLKIVIYSFESPVNLAVLARQCVSLIYLVKYFS
jgi:hypothetical protein